jgi:hypothetical protein
VQASGKRRSRTRSSNASVGSGVSPNIPVHYGSELSGFGHLRNSSKALGHRALQLARRLSEVGIPRVHIALPAVSVKGVRHLRQ